ncbi:MAG: hypothetical protein HDR72_05505 [Ruminococcaceae bacterium]|nr:hypothetical protein [Oscillospiraceae bacterium]
MKTKTHNRLAAVFMALAMLLTSISFSMFASAEDAAASKTKTYVLDAGSDFTEDVTCSEAASVKKGTDSFFTLRYRDGSKVETKAEKTIDGKSWTRRISMGNTKDSEDGSVEFTTEGSATVKIYWVANGEKYISVGKSKSEELTATTVASGDGSITTVQLSDEGTYYINNMGGGTNYLYRVEVIVEEAAEDEGDPTPAAAKDFTLDIDTEFPANVDAGTWSDGQKVKKGTDKFFSLYMNKKLKVDASSKTIEGVAFSRRLNVQGAMDISKPMSAIQFTTGGDNATVKIWWAASNDNRQMTIKDSDGNTIAETTKAIEKNATAYDELTIPTAGTYFLGSNGGGNYIFRVVVNTIPPAKAPPVAWGSVAAPSITKTEINGNTIKVNVSAVVDDVDGGDKVVVEMLKEGTPVKSITLEESDPTVEFTPTATGKYTFKVTLSRDSEEDVKEAESEEVDFTLPLAKPVLTATSKGNGRIELVWNEVPEADHYIISYGDETITTKDASAVYLVTGLTVGETYTFTVKAVRGDEESEASNEVSVEATSDAVIDWDFVYYGTSTGSSKNTHKVNDDGSVTVTATGNGGKIQYENKFDGLGFYYTRVSTADNFLLKAKVKVDKAQIESQTGFGLLALDSYPTKPNSTAEFYTNQFMAGAYKFHYFWDFENNEIPYDDSGTKYTMSHGIGVTRRFGITDETGNGFKTQSFPLEKSNVKLENESGTYSFDYKDGDEFIFEIGRNNTGYYAAYYTNDGKLVGKQQFYDPDALSVLDKNSVYVGFFTGRVSTATFTVLDFQTWDKASDTTHAEKQPITYVNPAAPISSAAVANSEDYTLIMTPNVKGTITVSVNGVEESEKITVTKPKTLYTKDVKLVPGKNEITVTFKPVSTAEQGFEYDYIQLRNEDAVTSSITVNYNTDYANQKNLYIAPDGKATGNGGPEYPLDIYTAVKVVQPGQTIVVMEGTYNLTETVTIQRGVDGEADNLIRMIADPEATTRPVFDFGGVGGGIRHGGNYWYFRGFDVTKSADKATGFRVCGNNNTLDQINTYTNGNTGIQISAFRDSSDPTDMWPQNNLILNCTSYDNADSDGNDADGFAAKLTVGNGNVFDGCAAYNNCDDGWDLFAKPTTGEIGSVTIRNCIAYNNGQNLSGKIHGDGNGFKLGGSNMAGKHVLENCVSFNNNANGITSNSGTGVTVKNCTSYNNKGAGLTLYSSNKTIEFTVDGVVVCGNSASVADNTSNKDSQIRNITTVTEDDFANTTFGGLKRKEDGTLDLGDFLKLKDETLGAGADLDKEGGSTSSGDVGEITPDENLPDPKPDAPSIPSTPSTPSSPSTPSTPSTPSDDKNIEFEDNNTDIEVTAPAGAFDNADEIKFNADPVLEETNDNTFTFDLSFTDGSGNKVQPKVAVTVRIPVPTALVGKTIYVYHVENNGSYTEIDCKVENGMVVFTASSFSKYIITSEKLNASNNSGDNSETSTSPETSNPSTGVSFPAAGIMISLAGLAAVCIFKRKRG